MAEASTRYFKHKPLDTTKQEIRLIRLLPPKDATDSRKNDISCTLEHFEIAQDRINSPTYTALSYTWGAGPAEHTVYINGLSFLVRRNLYDFLCSMCELRDFGSLLWVDQLCIDQEDLTERNHQVMMMADIYRQAEGVIAWLGESGPHTQAAMRLLDEVFRSPELTGVDDPEAFLDVETCSASMQQFKRWLRGQKYPISQANDWDGVSDLLWRPYWSRLWVVQELYLAQQVTLMCGTFRLALDLGESETSIVATSNLDIFVQTYDVSVGRASTKRLGNWHYLLGMCCKRGTWASKRKDRDRQLTDVIFLHCDRECVDPRDKVFGLQACVHPDERVPIDYTLTGQGVFASFAHTLLSSAEADLVSGDLTFENCVYYFRLLYDVMGLDPALWKSVLMGLRKDARKALRTAAAARAADALEDVIRLYR